MTAFETSRPLPSQGWKVHVAAHPGSSTAVLERVLPVLREYQVAFKVAASPQVLMILNAGAGGPSQIGKFVTVYPQADEQAKQLAWELDDATKAMGGPRIPSDRPLRPGSLVHYRFGTFTGAELMQLPDGSVASALLTPDGTLEPDQRLSVYSPPAWAEDPFESRVEPRALAGLEQAGNRRYRVLGLLSNSGRGPVFIGLDVDRRRRCVFKAAARGTQDHPSEGELALRREAALLRSLSAQGPWPAVYDLVETDDQLLLVMEDIEGISLGERMAESTALGIHLSPAEVGDLAFKVARAVEALHREGVVHRDLKSSNVLVHPTGDVALIDFEHAAGTRVVAGSGGTRGYMSPQQRAGHPTSELDDIYALGALLMLVATGCEPSQAPDATDLTTRSAELLRPDLPRGIAGLIRSCLSAAPESRPRDVSEFISRLKHRQNTDGGAGWPSPAADDNRFRRNRQGPELPDPLTTAQQLCDALCNRATPGRNGTLTWISTSPGTLPVPYRQINNGVPGVLLGLASGWKRFGLERHHDALTRGARWLMESEELPGAKISGLYAGEAGVGASLLIAGLSCGDASLVEGAYEVERRLRGYPFGSVDLYHGTAGRLRFLSMLWLVDQDRTVLAHALRCAEHLHETAVTMPDGQVCWHGDEPSGSRALASYAHGTAGIADVLLDLYELTGDRRHLDLVDNAAQWTRNAGVPSLRDGSGTDWGNGGAFGGLWCYGASGVGLLYLHLSRVRADSRAEDISRRAGNTAAFAGRYAGPGLCHGLGGSIEYLLDLHQHTEDPVWLGHASDLQRLLLAYRRVTSDGLGYPSTHEAENDSSYMLGDAGLVGTMLRQSTLGRLPRLLSIDALRNMVVSAHNGQGL
ncbi:lanthionine synthetase LanC family protein [Ornithinimicrobium sp. LYQ103]|uniref:class III lanthionine synthetase LanKC N-terminal domain-containing protein n=1 Tax=Ornithinimicrobium sp. LYQ103 TaxID=3378796 RepID=UPI00385189EF